MKTPRHETCIQCGRDLVAHWRDLHVETIDGKEQDAVEMFQKLNMQIRQEYENSSVRNYKTLKAIYEIIRIVVCWEEERE